MTTRQHYGIKQGERLLTVCEVEPKFVQFPRPLFQLDDYIISDDKEHLKRLAKKIRYAHVVQVVLMLTSTKDGDEDA